MTIVLTPVTVQRLDRLEKYLRHCKAEALKSCPKTSSRPKAPNSYQSFINRKYNARLAIVSRARTGNTEALLKASNLEATAMQYDRLTLEKF